MSDEIVMQIDIPEDKEGYSLLRCNICGEFFKCKPKDVVADEVLIIHCPGCGLISDDYFTDDVIDLAMNMAENAAMDIVYEELKRLERSTKGSFLQIKPGKKPHRNSEEPIRSGIENLKEAYFRCCKRSAKIKPLLLMTGCYCPFCGVKEYDIK